MVPIIRFELMKIFNRHIVFCLLALMLSGCTWTSIVTAGAATTAAVVINKDQKREAAKQAAEDSLRLSHVDSLALDQAVASQDSLTEEEKAKKETEEKAEKTNPLAWGLGALLVGYTAITLLLVYMLSASPGLGD